MSMQLECVEVCPHCGNENVYENIDPVAVGYKMVCNSCGAEIMLCDECMHADDNPCGKCNWHEEIRDGKKVGVCFRGVTRNDTNQETKAEDNARCSMPGRKGSSMYRSSDLNYREESFDLLPADEGWLYSRGGEWASLVHIRVEVIQIARPGGGIGGKCWHEHAVRGSAKTERVGDVDMVKYRRWDGTSFTVNPAYIVTIENYTLAIASFFRDKSEYEVRVLLEGDKEIDLLAEEDARPYAEHPQLTEYKV